MNPQTSLELDISKFKISSETVQIMLVIADNYTTTEADFYFYIKENNIWKNIIKSNAYLGLNGLGKLIEGDKKTPVGIYKFNKYFGIKKNPWTKFPYTLITESLYWNSDPNSDKYNLLVDYNEYKNFDTNKSEHLIDYSPGYNYAMNINYNEERIPNKGSGIFLHCFTKNKYTFGCISISENNMIEIYKILNENCCIIIDSKDNMKKYY